MKPAINIQQYQANLDILANPEELEAFMAFLEYHPEKLAQALGFNSPKDLLMHILYSFSKYEPIEESIFHDLMGDLSDAEKARIYNYYPRIASENSRLSVEHHKLAVENNEYESIISECAGMYPEDVSAMARSEIFSLMSDIEIRLQAEEYLAEHPGQFSAAYEYRGKAKSLKLSAISEAWKVVNLGRSEMLSKLALHYRDLRNGHMVRLVFKEMLIHGLLDPKIKMVLEHVINDDNISGIYSELAQMAIEAGYEEAVNSVVYMP
jgi:hypothetical protein